MNISNSNNIIFLISQPRSGSTLLQRILGSHPSIHTQSEPWILLHPLFPLKYEEIVTPYNSWLYSLGMKDFISSLPQGNEQYKQTISNAYIALYNSILKEQNKHFFLDKTPRYFHIIKELYNFFPESKFLFILRNPAAVITSIAKTFTKSDWTRLSDFRHDLLFAPKLIIDGKKHIGKSAYILHFESLLNNPDSEIAKVCDFLGIQYYPSMLNYNRDSTTKWRFGDQQNVYNLHKLNPEINNKWIEELKDHQTWRVVYDYIQRLGESIIKELAYDFKKLSDEISKHKPSDIVETTTIGLDILLENKNDYIIENYKINNELFKLKNIIKYQEKIISEQKSQIQELSKKHNI